MAERPSLLNFTSFGTTTQGFLTVAEISKDIPFRVERIFWIYHIPHLLDRGGHAHKKLYQVLIAVSGSVTIDTEDRAGFKETFVLDNPSVGLLIPPPFWHTMTFSHSGVLISLASTNFDESDYIRDYQVFKACL